MTQFNKDSKVKIEPDRKLQIYYHAESDTLSLWNGVPAGYGETVAEHLTAELNGPNAAEGGEVVGITLEHAAELLLPILYKEVSNAAHQKQPH